MKKMFFLGLLCLLLVGVAGSVFAASEHEIRKAYRSHFRGEKLTKEQQAMISGLSNEQKGKYYREALHESISKRKRNTPEALEKNLNKPGMRVEF